MLTCFQVVSSIDKYLPNHSLIKWQIIYYFLVEKVYTIRSVSKPRLKSKLYLFNCFGMLRMESSSMKKIGF